MLEPRVPKLTITLSATAPLGAKVLLDGAALGASDLEGTLPLDPGDHVIVVRVEGYDDRTYSISTAEGTHTSLEVEAGQPVVKLVPPVPSPTTGVPRNVTTPDIPPAPKSSSVAIGVFAASGLSLVVGSSLVAASEVPASRLSADALRTGGITLLVGGGLATATGLVLVLSPSKPASSGGGQVRIAPVAGPMEQGIRLWGSF